MSEEGVIQMFKGKEIKYTTTCETCSCSKFSSLQAACIHILFLRENENRGDPEFPLFSQNMFNKRYHREAGGLINVLKAQHDSEEVEMQETGYEVFENALEDDIVEEQVDTLVLTDRQKYNKIMPFLLRLGNLISVHGTKSFMEYMEEVELAEKRVRRGQNIFPKSAQRSDEVDNIEHEETEEDAVEETEEDAEEQSEEQQTVESDDVVSDGNRFRSLKMKERVKTKGRPKGKSKQ